MHTLCFMCPCSIMSAIDMFATFKVIEGKSGEKRIAITLNGTAFSRCSVCFNRLLSRNCDFQAWRWQAAAVSLARFLCPARVDMSRVF